jgi:hypothetical protein
VFAVHRLMAFHCEFLAWSGDRRRHQRRQICNDTTNTYFNHENLFYRSRRAKCLPPFQARHAPEGRHMFPFSKDGWICRTR